MSNWRQSGIVVREARPRDLDAIARLENESFETDRVSRRSLREFLRARPSAGDRGDHRRRTGGLRAGLAAQDRAGCAHLFARGRRAIRPPRRRPGAAAGLRGLCAPSPPRRPHPRSALRQRRRRSRSTRAPASANSASTPATTPTGRPPCATRSRFSPPPAAKPGTIRRRSAFSRCAAHRARARGSEEARKVSRARHE